MTAIDERDGKQRFQALVERLDKACYTAAVKCLADDLDALVVHLRCRARPTTWVARRTREHRGGAEHPGAGRSR
jgi:hypothetical protein